MDAIIENLTKRDNDELPKYFKSFGLGCYYDWDRVYSWYEVNWNDKQIIQIEAGTSKDEFIKLMVELFTDVWETSPIFLASNKNKKELFEFCQLFPEFNEKVKDLEVNLIDD